MKIKMEYFAQVRAAAEKDSETLTVSDGVTVHDILRLSAERMGAAFRDLVFPNGRLAPTILVSANDTAVTDTSMVLEPGDTLAILSPMSGG